MNPAALWAKEPVAIVNAVRLCCLAGMTFGMHLTNEQLVASMLALEAVLTLFTRAQVTSPQGLQDMTPKALASAQDAAQPVKEIVKKLPVVLLAAVLSLGAVMLPACAAPVTIVTPQGQAAYKADQVVVRVNELMNAAIAAEKAGTIKTQDARTIVTFCVSADKTLAATPAGWPAMLLTAWTETKAKLPKIENPAIVAAREAGA